MRSFEVIYHLSIACLIHGTFQLPESHQLCSHIDAACNE